MSKPSIAQILAARKAAATPAKVQAFASTNGLDPDTDAAIDRIDPPSAGKRRAGLVLSASTPLPQADIAEKAHYASKRLEVPQDLIQPADDEPMTVWLDHGAAWLCMPCSDKSMPPIKVLRLPWTIWPAVAPMTICEADIPY